MSRHAKHRNDGKPLATEVPVNAAAEEATEGLQGTETNAPAETHADGEHRNGPAHSTRTRAGIDGFAEEREPGGLLPEGTALGGQAPLP